MSRSRSHQNTAFKQSLKEEERSKRRAREKALLSKVKQDPEAADDICFPDSDESSNPWNWD